MDWKEGGRLMRAVFVGSSALAVETARNLLKRGYEVVVVEKEKARIEELSANLDCGYLGGDGSKPAVLREADPGHTDILFCLTGDDQVNILASLVGRSLGFARVVTKIEDQELEHICTELGLENTIVPTRTIGRFLTDMAAGRDMLELSTMIRGDARVFSFVAREEDEKEIKDLELPKKARVICFYRDEKFSWAEADTKLQKGDEVIVLTHSDNLPDLREMFTKKKAEKESEEPKA
jgi:trk system potassium uptake protein TrkA